jgi:hypothetical protein
MFTQPRLKVILKTQVMWKLAYKKVISGKLTTLSELKPGTGNFLFSQIQKRPKITKNSLFIYILN